MNEVFEKILERLEKRKKYFDSFYKKGRRKTDDIVKNATDIFYDEFVKIVQEVAEEYNNGWIACSERLPKYGEVVMCSCSNGGITISCITHKDVNQSKVVRFGSHSVVAWQPLPEPYNDSDKK